MAKLMKKKFFEVEIPFLDEKYEAYANSLKEIEGRLIKMDMTRALKGKSVDLLMRVALKEGKAVAEPRKITLLPFFIKHMLHTGISYVEDSIEAESMENKIIIKPFLITRKKVSRAIRRTLRNSARNWIIDYLKTKNNEELFKEILSNQFQRTLGLKLKKIYPLAICEIRILEIKAPLDKKEIKEVLEEKPLEIQNEKETTEEEIQKNPEEEKKRKTKSKK